MTTRPRPTPADCAGLHPDDLTHLLEALHVAADWTEGDIECANCGAQCELHAADVARIKRWRDIARRLSPDHSTPEGVPVVVADRAEYAVQYRHSDDSDWQDTRHSPMQTLTGARNYRAGYDREVGLPSRIILRHTRETLIEA